VKNDVKEKKEIDKEKEGEGWNRCGGYVYDDEKMLERGR
jgi:hypothetical protein